MAKKNKISLLLDSNQRDLPVVYLNTPENVDGSAASVQSAAINSEAARIVAVSPSGGGIRFLAGVNPTALTTSHYLPTGSDIYIQITVGDKVAILGGVANIAPIGKTQE